MTPSRQDSKFSRFWDVANKIALAVSITACTAIVNHEVRIAKIEGSEVHDWLRSDLQELKSMLKEMRGDFEARLRLIEAQVK